MSPMEMVHPAWRTIAQPPAIKLLVALAGVGLIALELWWFLGRHGEAGTAVLEDDDSVQTVRITVDGGYAPARVRLREGQPIRLVFLRLDPSACVARVVVPDLQRSLDLPLGEEATLDLPALEPGRYPFQCGMAMVRGELEVVGD